MIGGIFVRSGGGTLSELTSHAKLHQADGRPLCSADDFFESRASGSLTNTKRLLANGLLPIARLRRSQKQALCDAYFTLNYRDKCPSNLGDFITVVWVI